jgi:hypothetical protein
MATHDLAADAREWNLGLDGERASPSPLGWLSQLGMGLVSFFAKLTDTGYPAKEQAGDDAADARILAPFCCQLANPNGPFCSYTGEKYNYTCPSGYQKMWWYCCYGTRLLGCGECSSMSATNCWTPPWPCSIWWDVPGGKC